MAFPIPQIGYGTWNRDWDQGFRGVMDALEVGYRHIDTAEGYGNEDYVGRAIAASGVARSDIFLTTKVAPEHLGPNQVLPHAKASLERLGVDQVDLLLIHWPSIKDQFDIHDYMQQLAEVQDAGLTRHIGVSNFTRKHLDAALGVLGTRPLLTNQVEIHVLMQNRIIVDHTLAKGISTTAYSPLARGAVSEIPTLKAIGDKHDASAEQVALAFLLAEGHIIIPSSGTRSRIQSNFDAGKVMLSAEDVATIRKLDENRRLVDGAWCPVWDS